MLISAVAGVNVPYCCTAAAVVIVVVVQLIIATGNVQGAFGAASSSVHRYIVVFFG